MRRHIASLIILAVFLAAAPLRQAQTLSAPKCAAGYIVLPEDLHDMLGAFDDGNVGGWAKYLDPNVTFTMANEAPIYGRANAEAFFGSIVPFTQSIEHEILDVWWVPGGYVLDGILHIVRAADGVQISMPFTDLFKIDQGCITEYTGRLFFAPPMLAPGSPVDWTIFN